MRGRVLEVLQGPLKTGNSGLDRSHNGGVCFRLPSECRGRGGGKSIDWERGGEEEEGEGVCCVVLFTGVELCGGRRKHVVSSPVDHITSSFKND